MDNNIGLGCNNFKIAVYIGNIPYMPEYQALKGMTPLSAGEIYHIGQECGNGWRKVFNVYAKVLFALDKKLFEYAGLSSTWQMYRDEYLLQSKSETALLFSPPILSTNVHTLHIICGRTYANQLKDSNNLDVQLTWSNSEFAINQAHNLVVCPYFDYRQLSNIKIETLASILNDFKNKKAP